MEPVSQRNSFSTGDAALGPGSEVRLSRAAHVVVAVLLWLSVCVGVGANALVLLLFARRRALRVPSFLLLANMSASELLGSLSTTAMLLLWGPWHGARGQAVCLWDGFSLTLFGTVSAGSLALLAFERCSRLSRPQDLDLSWGRRASAAAWLYALAWSSAPLLGWGHYMPESHGLGCSLDWRPQGVASNVFVLLLFLGCLVLPVAATALCYGRIVLTIRALRSRYAAHTRRAAALACYEQQAARAWVLVLLLCFTARTPHALLALMDVQRDYPVGSSTSSSSSSSSAPVISAVPMLLTRTTATYHPLLYIFTNKQFRRCAWGLLVARWRAWPVGEAMGSPPTGQVTHTMELGDTVDVPAAAAAAACSLSKATPPHNKEAAVGETRAEAHKVAATRLIHVAPCTSTSSGSMLLT
ncbi:opsin-3-like [Petromyzon marinus]|uniref:opsin-3-like n=1 Tax=Petromyzon marinus TaxID=7757 RepID=UPI003F6FE5A4